MRILLIKNITHFNDIHEVSEFFLDEKKVKCAQGTHVFKVLKKSHKKSNISYPHETAVYIL